MPLEHCSSPESPSSTPEKDRFIETVSTDIGNGLRNIAFVRGSNGAGSSEEVYAEINRMWDSRNLRTADSEKL